MTAYKGRATGGTSLWYGIAVVLFALLIVLSASAVAHAAEPTPVTTRELDTGPSSELISTVPIASGSPSPSTVYSLKVSGVQKGEVLRATGDLELSGSRSYASKVQARLVLVEGASETNGTVVTPWSAVTLASGSTRLTLPIDGTYQASSELGTRYLKLQVQASSAEAKSGDTLAVASGSGRLAVTRYAPTPGPTSLPTHELQPLLGELSEQVTTIPVDSEWRVVLSRKVSDLAEEDLLDTAAQLGVENTSGTAVKLESRVLRTTSSTSTGGGEMVAPTAESLSAGTKYARIAGSNELGPLANPASNYINLSVRAIPLEGSPKPLTVVAGSGSLSILRFAPNPGNAGNPLLEGTFEQSPVPWIGPSEVSIPFAAEGKEPRVVQSLPIFGLNKGHVIRARSTLIANLTGKAAAPVETAIVLANSKTSTTGETVAARSGDTVLGGGVHTLVKDATYIAPTTSQEVKYLNLVAYANRAPKETGESLSLEKAVLNFSRSQPTAPFVEGFENGLDALNRLEYNGLLSASTAQAREGVKSIHVELDPSQDNYPYDEEGIRRDEAQPGDIRGSGGHDGEDSWYGFSVYFPESFKVPVAEQFSSGTWNIFSQWHHTNVGLDCTTSLSPPIAFAARYYKANSHTNPGESKTATPVSGDYLEVGFNGGQINEECNKTINPAKNYVLAPLERGYWYDFILHTRWTTEEGGPGDSVSEVWMNGKQVLGNQTNPVSVPTLFWHGTPAIHDTEIYRAFGLYRGPSIEDPPTDLFLDSFRTGDSYAQVAPEVHAPRIDAESYPATLKGAGLPELSTNLGTFKCVGTTLEGAATGATSQLSLQPKYGECEITVAGTKFVSSVKMNGCHYVLGVKNAGPPYVGTWGVVCEKEGEAIEFKLTKNANNCLKLFPQQGLEGVSPSNVGEGSKRGVGVAAEIKGAKYEWLGVCGKEVRTDGVLKGETTLTASNSKAEQVGAYLTGDEVGP